MWKKLDFDSNFIGLQMLSGRGTELEILQIDRILEGKVSSSLGKQIHNGKTIFLEYPFEAVIKGNELLLKYSIHPKGWIADLGTISIRFRNLKRREILEIHWKGEDGKKYLIQKGRDWKKVYPSKAEIEQTLNNLGRKRVSRSVYERPKQSIFRKMLIQRYGKCFVTGETIEDVLDACHIIPVKEKGNEVFWNGLLLRVDLHRLFDNDKIKFSIEGKECYLRPTQSLKDNGYYKNLFDNCVLPKEIFKNIEIAVKKITFSQNK